MAAVSASAEEGFRRGQNDKGCTVQQGTKARSRAINLFGVLLCFF